MIDMEKVIEDLKYIGRWHKNSDGDSNYASHYACAKTIRRVIRLLKEREPVKPIERNGFWYCGACKDILTRGRQKFCSNCGRAVKWDE